MKSFVRTICEKLRLSIGFAVRRAWFWSEDVRKACGRKKAVSQNSEGAPLLTQPLKKRRRARRSSTHEASGLRDG